mmetsp:Transcript_46241/g.100423  ORF Transcript_46241/g.100423 Transcript_46241/m.100423 type:complete len:284 (-) Transcript_46241:78-929(-)
MSRAGHVGRVRTTVAGARSSLSDENETESMRNLAYVVNSANDNITALRQTVKQQEKEIAEKSEQAVALQRNYETLSRIRQADQREFLLVKKQKDEQQLALERVQEELAAERERVEGLTAQLHEMAAAQTQLQELRLRLDEAERQRTEQAAAATQAKRQATELVEANKALKLSVERLSRAQQDALARSEQSEATAKQLQAEKEQAERERDRMGSKLAVQERQMKTFLDANEALENDLREQMKLVASHERRKQEQEVERETIEAYYNARLQEMQSQYDKLLAQKE